MLRGATRDADLHVVVLHPALAAERPEPIERLTLDVAMDAPLAPGRFPLVLVSHGTGGSHLLYRGLAAHLARQGFVVALVEHPHDHLRDDALAGTHTILADRPRQLRQVIDWAYADAELGPRLAPGASPSSGTRSAGTPRWRWRAAARGRVRRRRPTGSRGRCRSRPIGACGRWCCSRRRRPGSSRRAPWPRCGSRS